MLAANSTKRILVLHCGGTIGMGPTSEGYATLDDFGSRLRQRLRDHVGGELPGVDILELTPLIDSANMVPDDWTRIACALKARWDDYDGFLLLHGTDTMAYTASALSFLFRRMDKPVILTGSQIPLCEPRSDAMDNLVNSLVLASNYPIAEVCICFHGRLLRGNRSIKFKSTGFDAFDSPNLPWLGKTGIQIELREDLLLPPAAAEMQTCQFIDGAVGVLQLYPGISHHFFSAALADASLKALVIQSYGVGNGPNRDPELLRMLAGAVERGISIVNITRCPQGSVLPLTYATGASLAKAGAISGADLTLEAAYTKLHVLLGQGASRDAIQQTFAEPWCGECTPHLANP